ncbi:hypothetical protein Q666_16610 [Marinobacter sp. ES-1]|nr:hypothetical protein Q666_16610 [Marinobacter sp. ES-1]
MLQRKAGLDTEHLTALSYDDHVACATETQKSTLAITYGQIRTERSFYQINNARYISVNALQHKGFSIGNTDILRTDRVRVTGIGGIRSLNKPCLGYKGATTRQDWR